MRADGIALVTGASRGLGRALALELARRGFEVVATMRDPSTAGAALAQEADAAGVRLRVERLDVTRPDTIHVPDGLRVLVNNAGLEGGFAPLEEAPLELWRTLFETNLFGLVEVTRCALPALRATAAAGGGAVVCNITSAAVCFPMPFFAPYRASKAAVAALGESLLAELAPLGVRVLEIRPGPIATDMLDASARPPAVRNPDAYGELAARAHAGRHAAAAQAEPPEDAAAAIADAILDDAAPLRLGCDPLGRTLLAGWSTLSDDRWLDNALAGLLGGDGEEDEDGPEGA